MRKFWIVRCLICWTFNLIGIVGTIGWLALWGYVFLNYNERFIESFGEYTWGITLALSALGILIFFISVGRLISWIHIFDYGLFPKFNGAKWGD